MSAAGGHGQRSHGSDEDIRRRERLPDGASWGWGIASIISGLSRAFSSLCIVLSWLVLRLFVRRFLLDCLYPYSFLGLVAAMSSKQNLYITLQYLRTTNGTNRYMGSSVTMTAMSFLNHLSSIGACGLLATNPRRGILSTPRTQTGKLWTSTRRPERSAIH